MSQKLYQVKAGDPISASEYNRMTRAVNSFLQENHSPMAAQYAAVAQTAEIAVLDFANSLIQCIETTGATDQFDVRLPELYTEASRAFGGTIGTVTYVYSDLNTRTATGTGDPETQYLTPPLVVGEVIEIMFAGGPDDYVMLGDGRMWAIDPP